MGTRILGRIIRSAALGAPGNLCERLEEEWLAAVGQQRGRLRRLSFALGCCWAARVIARDRSAVSVPATSSASGVSPMSACAVRSPALFARGTAIAARNETLCEINTTPLIDVMLVLLVTLILTLPIMTHAVTLDLPQAPVSDPPRSEVIELEVEFDGAVLWNGSPVSSFGQLESYFRAEAGKDPQPEVHLRADRRAKYDVVARVLASAQRNRMKKIGFADTAQFKD